MIKRETIEYFVGDTVFVVAGVPADKDGAILQSDCATAELQVSCELAKRGMVSGDAFKFVRKSLGMKASEVASLLDRTPETISRWENGKTPVDRLSWVVFSTLAFERYGEKSQIADRLAATVYPAGEPFPKRIILTWCDTMSHTRTL